MKLTKMHKTGIAVASAGVLGVLGRFYFAGGKNHYTPDMTSKTIVITGGNSGKIDSYN